MPRINIVEVENSALTYSRGSQMVFCPSEKDAPANVSTDLNNCVIYMYKEQFKPDNPTNMSATEKYIENVLTSGLPVCVCYTNNAAANWSSDTFSFLNDKDTYDIKFITSGPVPTITFSEFVAGESSMNGSYTFDNTSNVNTYSPATGNYASNVAYYALKAEEVTANESTYKNYYVKNGTDYVQNPAANFVNTAQYYSLDEAQLTGHGDLSLLTLLCNIAEKREDCVVIPSCDVSNYSLTEVKKALDGNIGSLLLKGVPTEGFPGSLKYAGLFTARMNSLGGESTEYAINTYPDLAYLQGFAAAYRQGKQWDATAGLNRGVVNDFSENACVKRYDLDNNVIGEEGRSFNGIVNMRNTGNVIWGDRTLYKNTGKVVASSFLSIRNIVADLAKRVYSGATRFIYETNNAITWANFKNSISPLLEQMVQAYVIADYDIIRKPSDKRATINCEIHISPYGPVENFDVAIFLDANGLDINIVE